MAFAVLALCFTFNLLARGISETYAVFLLPLGSEFGWERAELASVYSIYMLVHGITAPLAGLLFDRLGPRLVYAFGFACYGGGYYLAGS
jgi:MFS family permease